LAVVHVMDGEHDLRGDNGELAFNGEGNKKSTDGGTMK
jgi:hypothetical protein